MKVDDSSEDAFIDKNAVDIARTLQKLRGIDGDYDSDSGSSQHRIDRRKTIHNLEKHRQKKRPIGTLDVAFKKRFFSLTANQEGEEGIAGILYVYFRCFIHFFFSSGTFIQLTKETKLSLFIETASSTNLRKTIFNYCLFIETI